MKKLLFTLAILVSLSSFGQEQILNGISLNAPNGFTKTGNLQWRNGNEAVLVQSIEGSYAGFKDLQSGAKLDCEKGSRASTFVDFVNLEISGETYGFCIQKGQNTLALVQTYVFRDGYTYVVSVAADPDNYERCFEIIGYMITRITASDYNKVKEPNLNADTYLNNGNSKHKLKDYYGAISDYTKAIELNPKDANTYYNRGNSKRKLNDYYGAISDYTKAIELNPKDAYAYYNRGISKDDLKDYYGAISDYTKAIELNPNYTKSYFNRGVSKAKLKDYNGAISDYNKVMEIDPNYADAYYNKGLSKYKLKDYYGAISDFNKAIEIDPNYAKAYNNRSVAKYIINDLNGACKDAKKAESLGFDVSKLIELVCN